MDFNDCANCTVETRYPDDNELDHCSNRGSCVFCVNNCGARLTKLHLSRVLSHTTIVETW